MKWDLKIRKRQAPYVRSDKENRLYKTDLALAEIAFAKGYNSVTEHPLPNWRHYKGQYLNKCRTEEEAYQAGITFATNWVSGSKGIDSEKF